MKYIAINQHGHTYHGLEHPRKDLLERLGRKHANRMYVGSESGEVKHIGYVIRGEWLTVYKVERMEVAR